MHIVGLTGGIGSGKSLASSIFEDLGVPIIDLDKIAKEISKKNAIGYKEIVKKFGLLYLDKSMNIDRKKLQNDVFSKPKCKKIVEEILHPLIYKELLSRIRETTNRPYIVVVVPLLFEKKTYQKIINESLLIDCSEHLQLKRIIERDGITSKLAKKIMGSQMTRDKKLNEANTTIENSGSENTLQTNIMYYHKNILKKLNEKLL
jgi:dephospho-CoA kinase|tara:strand:+ start:1571 stop:2182 length:612 start_codon:yes stop_codon:yes gene_type:complete